ncbi:hypothetical protein JHD50_09980 [Sulfurimonas sp. MAG313]|nr:hypothetical protein [Sulfurimonas sp. MAG313]MDF1881627.1 hypothetical protein [Sulfurimonas sp. MAG313]
MQLETTNNIVSVRGNISTVSDFEKIKNNLDSVKQSNDHLVLKIYDSLVINSSLIGFLVKIIHQDKVRLDFYAGSDILFELLDDLGLSTTLNLRKL